MQSAEDRVAHLNMVKNKLEQTLDDLDDTLERERRAKGDAEKNKRRVESELKACNEMAADMERGKKEMEASIQRREKDIAELMAKLQDEQAGVGKFQRDIKELQGNIFFSFDFLHFLVHFVITKPFKKFTQSQVKSVFHGPDLPFKVVLRSGKRSLRPNVKPE